MEIRNYGLRLLGKREYSVKKFREKLRQKFPSKTEKIEKIITEFTEKEWLSDQRFLEIFLKEQIRQMSGPKKIRQKLMMQGVSAELINEKMNKFFIQKVKQDLIKKLVQKKEQQLENKNLKPIEKKKKIADFLFAHGFDWGDFRAQISIDK